MESHASAARHRLIGSVRDRVAAAASPSSGSRSTSRSRRGRCGSGDDRVRRQRRASARLVDGRRDRRDPDLGGARRRGARARRLPRGRPRRHRPRRPRRAGGPHRALDPLVALPGRLVGRGEPHARLRGRLCGGIATVRLARERWAAVGWGVLLALARVCLYGLATKVAPGWLASDELYARLREPYGLLERGRAHRGDGHSALPLARDARRGPRALERRSPIRCSRFSS